METTNTTATRQADDSRSGIHVTAIRNGGVYGHSTDCCDQGGCAGTEQYYSRIDPAEVAVGEVVADPADSATPVRS